MKDLRDIVSENYSTYYDARTGEARSSTFRIIVFCALSLAVFCLGWEPSDEASSALITVLSVLLGFTFSVTVFVVSSNFKIGTDASIEEENNLEMYEKLSGELVSNFIFFSLLALSAILLFALILAMPPSPKLPNYLPGSVKEFAQAREYLSSLEKYLSMVGPFFASLGMFVLLELSHSFQRSLRRLLTLFELKSRPRER